MIFTTDGPYKLLNYTHFYPILFDCMENIIDFIFEFSITLAKISYSYLSFIFLIKFPSSPFRCSFSASPTASDKILFPLLQSPLYYFKIVSAPSQTFSSACPSAALNGLINLPSKGITFSEAPSLKSNSLAASLAIKLKGCVVSTSPSKQVTKIGSNPRSILS